MTNVTKLAILRAATVATLALRSWPCVIIPELAWLEATIVPMHLILGAGLVLMDILPVAVNEAVLPSTVLLLMNWRSISLVNLNQGRIQLVTWVYYFLFYFPWQIIIPSSSFKSTYILQFYCASIFSQLAGQHAVQLAVQLAVQPAGRHVSQLASRLARWAQ